MKCKSKKYNPRTFSHDFTYLRLNIFYIYFEYEMKFFYCLNQILRIKLAPTILIIAPPRPPQGSVRVINVQAINKRLRFVATAFICHPQVLAKLIL